MRALQILPLLIFLQIFLHGNCARILTFFHIPSKSHHILGSKLLKELALRGHDVTMVSPYPFKNKIPNYRDIFLKEMLEYKDKTLQNFMKPNVALTEKIVHTNRMFEDLCDIALSNVEVQNLKNEKFDLILQFAIFSECLFGFSYHFNAPIILMNTLGSTRALDHLFGNSAPLSYVPNLGLSFSDEMTFQQRLLNVLFSVVIHDIGGLYLESKQQKLLSKYFPEAPSLQELKNNVSLVLLNSHYSIETPRPYVPNMIPIGGFHIEEPKQLPIDLQEFLDKANEGVIFFSLGSNVKISDLPTEKVDAIVKTLGKLPMKVLFKTETELPNLPSNIHTGKWLPQNDILAHRNVKLFISHGGLLSSFEAVYHGVPIVGIPIFGDQEGNIANAVVDGYAIKVAMDQLDEEQFSKAIDEILRNPKYRQNIQLRSSLMRDQPIKPLDKAIFWVEHVLKYKGAAHLKNAGTKLSLYQYLLLDVIAFIFLVLAIICYILYFMIKMMIKCIRCTMKQFKRKID